MNKLAKECHEVSLEKGWYDCLECKGHGRLPITPSGDLPCDSDRDCNKCNGTGKRERPVIEIIMLIVTELSEAVEADRKDFYSDYLKFVHNNEDFERDVKDRFEDEIADAFIRLFDLCGYLNIDIEKHIELKMKYNKTRPYKHGKEY